MCKCHITRKGQNNFLIVSIPALFTNSCWRLMNLLGFGVTVGETSYEIALSQSDQAEASLLRAEDELSKTRLTAPKYGIVTSLTKQKPENTTLVGGHKTW